MPSPPHESKLSLRQRQILELIRRGKSNNEIAFDLGIGIGTVKQHVVALFRKLKVTNRTMAVSRSAEPSAFMSGTPFLGSDEVILERRPCIVLSLIFEEPHPSSLRLLHSIMAAFAQEAGDILLSRRDKGCDLVLGIDRVSELDPIRALQRARQAAEALAGRVPGSASLKDAIAAGLAVASMFRRGGWSGEAIAGSAIVLARHRAEEAEHGTLLLDPSFIEVLRLCDIHIRDNRPVLYSLNNPESFPLTSRRAETPFIGRLEELSVLTSMLSAHHSPEPRIAHLYGEPGSGKSRICDRLLQAFQEENQKAKLFRFLPSENSNIFLDVAAGARYDIQAVIRRVTEDAQKEIILIDNTQWMNEEVGSDFMAQASKSDRRILFVERAWMIPQNGPGLKLCSMQETEVEQLAVEAIDPALGTPSYRRQAAKAIAAMAGGNPFFAVEMACCRTMVNSLVTSGEKVKPFVPLQIVMRVMAHLDALQPDRRLLRVAASHTGGIEPMNLALAMGEEKEAVQSSIDHALERGILQCRENDRVHFTHPMVQNVIRFVGMDI